MACAPDAVGERGRGGPHGVAGALELLEDRRVDRRDLGLRARPVAEPDAEHVRVDRLVLRRVVDRRGLGDMERVLMLGDVEAVLHLTRGEHPGAAALAVVLRLDRPLVVDVADEARAVGEARPRGTRGPVMTSVASMTAVGRPCSSKTRSPIWSWSISFQPVGVGIGVSSASALPSILATMSSGSSTHSSVRPRTNSPGWMTNWSPGSTTTSSVRLAGGSRRSIAVVRWLWKTRKESPRRRSTDAGWTCSGIPRRDRDPALLDQAQDRAVGEHRLGSAVRHGRKSAMGCCRHGR